MESFSQCLGTSLARLFCVKATIIDKDTHLRLQPILDSFECPITLSKFVDPVATQDGHVYEREAITNWMTTCKLSHQPITSPLTGLALRSADLISVEVLRNMIETYLAHQPDLRYDLAVKHSFEESAAALQKEFFEKQSMISKMQDDISHNKALAEAALALQGELLEKQSIINKISIIKKMREEIDHYKAKLQVSGTTWKSISCSDAGGDEAHAQSIDAMCLSSHLRAKLEAVVATLQENEAISMAFPKSTRVLFTFTNDEHLEMPLEDKLEEARVELGMSEDSWQRRVVLKVLGNPFPVEVHLRDINNATRGGACVRPSTVIERMLGTSSASIMQ